MCRSRPHAPWAHLPSGDLLFSRALEELRPLCVGGWELGALSRLDGKVCVGGRRLAERLDERRCDGAAVRIAVADGGGGGKGRGEAGAGQGVALAELNTEGLNVVEEAPVDHVLLAERVEELVEEARLTREPGGSIAASAIAPPLRVPARMTLYVAPFALQVLCTRASCSLQAATDAASAAHTSWLAAAFAAVAKKPIPAPFR